VKGSWLLLVASVASAGTLTKPEGWTASDSKELAAGASEATHFGVHGGPGSKVSAMQIAPPGDSGVMLFATRIEMTVPNDPAAVRAEIDAFHGAAKRAQLAGTTIVEQGWTEHVDDATKQVDAALEYHDTTNKLTVTSRIVIAAEADTLVAVTGECMARDDAAQKQATLCKLALASLDPDPAPKAKHRDIALAPAGTPAPEDHSENPGPSMSDGSHIPIPPLIIHPDTQPDIDRRPVYIGAGIVLLAGVFWWNMKRKRAEDDEDEHE
jgi:hypothetical protein